MSEIFINVLEGQGYGYVSNFYPSDGEIVTLYVEPAVGYIIKDITAWDSYDHSIALNQYASEQSFPFNAAWNNMYIDLKFEATTPPTPTIPPWLLFKFNKIYWRYHNGIY